jgi:hypothetical protein
LEARRVTARCEMINCLAKQIAIEVGGFCIPSRSFSPSQTGDLRREESNELGHRDSALQCHRDLRTRRDKRGGGSTCWRGCAGVVPK